MFARQRFLFEAPEDGGGDAGGAGDWQPTQEWGQRIDGFIEQAAPTLTALGEILNDPGYGEPGGGQPADPMEQWQRDYANWQEMYGQGAAHQPPPQFDPSMLNEAIQRGIEQAIGPFQPLLGTLAEREGEQIARSTLAELKSEVGDFNEDQAIKLAQLYLGQGIGPDEALRQAAQDTFAYEESIRAKALEAHQATLTAAAQASGDLGAGSALEAPGVPTGRNRYEEAMARVMSARSPVGASDL